MNEIIMAAGGGLAGGISVGGMITFFVLNKKVKEYIRDAMGGKQEVNATIINAPRSPSWEDHEELKDRVTRMEQEFSLLSQKQDLHYRELIKAGEVRATKLHERINELPRVIIGMLRDTKGLIQ